MDLRPLLRSYGQVVFARSPLVGALLLVATMVEPVVGLHGLSAAVLAWAIATLLKLPAAGISEGVYGYNAVLAGLAVGAMFPASLTSAFLVALVAAGTVLATAALHSRGNGLPPLTLPFLGALWGLTALSTAILDPGQGLGMLGALFFVPHPVAGALVLAALVAWSRQGAVLAGVGVAVAWGMAQLLGPPPPMLAVNLALVAMAIGGVWFVPSRSSIALAAAAAAVTGLFAYGLNPVVSRSVPLSVLPFNLGTWMVLLAMRMRTADDTPKAVDTTPGTPEQNLAYHHTRVARFGARYGVRFRLPVLGRWVVTQAESDGPTHRDAWRHAIDLEVEDAEGALHQGAGTHIADFLCYRLPVVAPADGTVAAVIDGIRDNPLGEVELEDNWGNVVVLWHAPGLYSLVAHLSPGSIDVTLGQRVHQGDILGRCGSSGRAPRPHVHFQLQGSAAVGAPTLPLELHDIVDAAHDRVRSTWAPKTGDAVRNIAVDDALVAAMALVPGTRWAVGEGITAEVDPAGVPYLSDGTGSMVYALRPDLLTFFAPLAAPTSPLQLFRSALPRLPLEPGVRWSDHLSPMATVPWFMRPVWEILSILVPWEGVRVDYEIDTTATGWTVRGTTETGTITTEVRIDAEGPECLTVTTGGHTRKIERSATAPQENP